MGVSMAASIINIKEGMPKVDVATRKLRLELNTLRRVGVNQVKIIHGYGSTGKGGLIKTAFGKFSYLMRKFSEFFRNKQEIWKIFLNIITLQRKLITNKK